MADKKSGKGPIIAGVVILLLIIGGISSCVKGGNSNSGGDDTDTSDTSDYTPAPEPTTVQTPAPAPTTQTPVAPTVTSLGLTNGMAKVTCDHEGDAQFPYGYDPHWILGNIAQNVEGDHWFMKYQATVKNAYNAKRDMTIECTVTGTEAAPSVVSFNAY